MPNTRKMPQRNDQREVRIKDDGMAKWRNDAKQDTPNDRRPQGRNKAEAKGDKVIKGGMVRPNRMMQETSTQVKNT